MWHMASTRRGQALAVMCGIAAFGAISACGSAEPELPIPSLAATPPSESPKDRVYEQIQGSSPLTADELYRLDEARLAATEAIVAECMAAQGFEYVPFAPEISSGGAAPIDLSVFDEAEAARTEGYGIIAPDLAVRDPRTPSSNQLIRAALSSSERLAYLGREGRDAIRTVMRELINAGYAELRKEQIAAGHWVSHYTISDRAWQFAQPVDNPVDN